MYHVPRQSKEKVELFLDSNAGPPRNPFVGMAGEEQTDLRIQRRPYGNDGGSITTVWLPEERIAKAKWWVFTRELEKLVYDTDRCSSNVLRDLEQLGLEDAGRLYKRAGDHGITEEGWKGLIRAYNSAKKSWDPMGGPGKQVQVLPIKVCCTLALNRGARAVLEALGGTVPEAWIKQDRIAENDANDEVKKNSCKSRCVT